MWTQYCSLPEQGFKQIKKVFFLAKALSGVMGEENDILLLSFVDTPQDFLLYSKAPSTSVKYSPS